MSDVYRRFDAQNLKDDKKAEEALASNGLQFVQLQSDEMPRWRDVAIRASDKLAREGAFSAALLEQVRQHLADFRARAKATQAVTQAR